jgi:aminoglycoside 2'-N-acetyltransferase I
VSNAAGGAGDRPMRAPLDPGRLSLRRLSTSELSAGDVAAIRSILVAAFGGDDEEEGFTEDDWEHALGGRHVVLELDGEIVSHGSVVEREIHIGGRPLRAGYVEAVATAPGHQGAGLGSIVVEDLTAFIRAEYEVGVLGTGRHQFYERLGWRTWRGPSSVRTAAGEHPTPDEDGFILVLETPASPRLDVDQPISCDWRPGDVW